jgi:hypothetical protein
LVWPMAWPKAACRDRWRAAGFLIDCQGGAAGRPVPGCPPRARQDRAAHAHGPLGPPVRYHCVQPARHLHSITSSAAGAVALLLGPCGVHDVPQDLLLPVGQAHPTGSTPVPCAASTRRCGRTAPRAAWRMWTAMPLPSRCRWVRRSWSPVPCADQPPAARAKASPNPSVAPGRGAPPVVMS